MTDLTDLGIAGIRDGVRDGSFSARDVADAFDDFRKRIKGRKFILIGHSQGAGMLNSSSPRRSTPTRTCASCWCRPGARSRPTSR